MQFKITFGQLEEPPYTRYTTLYDVLNLVIGSFLVGLAWTIATYRQVFDIYVIQNPLLAINVKYLLFVAFPTAFLSLALHELAHKLTASALGYKSRIRISPLDIILGIITAYLFGFVIGAPLATEVAKGEKIEKRDLGLIAFAGPVVNILLASVSYPFVEDPYFSLLFALNFMLALTNLLPLPGLATDGTYMALYLEPKVFGISLPWLATTIPFVFLFMNNVDFLTYCITYSNIYFIAEFSQIQVTTPPIPLPTLKMLTGQATPIIIYFKLFRRKLPNWYRI